SDCRTYVQRGDYMDKNVGQTDRIVRIVVGVLAILVAGALAMDIGRLGSPVGIVAALLAAIVGVVLIGTALTQSCLLYNFIGVDTSD
ncbi:MAG: DUF2892 domain-containing protein, partial [Halococcoides sp.]